MPTQRHEAQVAVRPAWPQQPNIVFVLTDDQGYGEVAAHGNPVIQTPTLDRLHREAVRFERFHVSPTCAPTRSALMTGRHEFRNRISHTILGRSLIDADLYVLPDLLHEAGYRTGMFGKWHLGDNYPCRPQDLGFDESLHHGGGGICQTPDYWGNSYFSPTLEHNGSWEPSDGYCTDVFFRAGLDWIARVKDNGPFYAYIATNCPHRPLQVPRRYSDPYRESGVDRHAQRYYGMISNVDENLGGLLRQLEDWGILDDTLVIFMGDNGSAEAGRPERGLFNAGMRGGKGSPFEGGVRVPCYFYWPKAFGAGHAVEPVCAHVDFLPTIADLVGGSLPAGLDIEGRSFANLLADPQADWPDRMLVTHVGRWGVEDDPNAFKHRAMSVRSQRYRWTNGRELYDLWEDPGEQTDVAANHPDVIAAMAAYYDAWWAKTLPIVREPQRIHLGNPAENPARLTCHDWQESVVAAGDASQRRLQVWQQEVLAKVATDESPEQQKEIAFSGMGAWGVVLEQAGTYRVTVRKLPAAATVAQRALKAGTANVLCAGVSASRVVAAGDTEAVLDLELPAGEAMLEAWFTGQVAGDALCGAFFLDVEWIG